MARSAATPSPAAPARRMDHRWITFGGVILTLAIMTWLASWDDDPLTPAAVNLGAAFWTLAVSLPGPLLWLAAAAGYGCGLARLVLPARSRSRIITLTLGVASLIFIDSACGSLGLLAVGGELVPAGGALGAWLALLPGWVLLVMALRRARPGREDVADPAAAPTPPAPSLPLPLSWIILLAAPALAVMLIAVTLPPESLWRTEFSGYDVLSYHLQLPREWVALGRIMPLEHNVYSFLPSGMEAASYHLMLLREDPLNALYSAQILHAALALLAAAATGRLVQHLLPRPGTAPKAAGVVTAVLVLATPWVIVTGTLAYDEMLVLLMLAGGLLLLTDDDLDAPRLGLALGLMAGVAILAKLTAAFMVALPLGALLLLLRRPPREWLRAGPIMVMIAFVILLPWLIRNGLAAGNPVFPFAADLFGPGHWTEAQHARWQSGHQSRLPLTDRIITGFDRFLRFGIGANPDDSGREPWLPQWSILPWIGLAALALGVVRPRTRRWSALLAFVLGIQLIFWLVATHIQSRFMLPAVVPLAAASGFVLGELVISRTAVSTGEASRSRPMRALAMIVPALLIAHALTWLNVWLFRGEISGAPAARIGIGSLLQGEGLPEDNLRRLAQLRASIFISHRLPHEARTLLVGEAAPLYYQGDFDYATVWDQSALSPLVAAHPDEPAAWFAALRDQGYTHLLIDETMLRIWQHSGWLDPHLAPETIIPAAERHLTRLIRDAAGRRIYRLGP